MKQIKVVWAIALLILLADVGHSNGQSGVVDHSFLFLEKNGLAIGYDIQYLPYSQLDNSQKENLFMEVKQIAFNYGRVLPLMDFYFKRDSIEKTFTKDVLNQAAKIQLQLKEVKIINLLVPKEIADAIGSRAKAFNEPQPTRIRSYDN